MKAGYGAHLWTLATAGAVGAGAWMFPFNNLWGILVRNSGMAGDQAITEPLALSVIMFALAALLAIPQRILMATKRSARAASMRADLNSRVVRGKAPALVVDTGLHAKGWSRDEAIAYMVQHTSLAAENATLEVDRYIVAPGQATSYKVGEAVIQGLRARSERAQGARFDLKLFHDQVLNTGSLPLRVLEAKNAQWLN
ncbi:MAG: DUF885 family protein [Alphaproteobacteria bacterium]